MSLKRLLLIFALATGAASIASAQDGFTGQLRDRGIVTKNGPVKMRSLCLDPSCIDVYATTTSANTITHLQSGHVILVSEISNDPITFNLPDAVAGEFFWFIDNDATAAADLIVNPQDGDKINNGTAGATYSATGDAFGELVCLMAIDGVNWMVLYKIGTWG